MQAKKKYWIVTIFGRGVRSTIMDPNRSFLFSQPSPGPLPDNTGYLGREHGEVSSKTECFRGAWDLNV